MPATRTHARIAFEEPAVGPLDVKVFDGEGRLLRIIPGAALKKRVRDHREPPKVGHGDGPKPTAKMVKATSRAGRP